MKWFWKLIGWGFLIGFIILVLFLLYCAEKLVAEWAKPMQPFLHDVGQALQGIFVCVVVGVVAHTWDKAQRTLDETLRSSQRIEQHLENMRLELQEAREAGKQKTFSW